MPAMQPLFMALSTNSRTYAGRIRTLAPFLNHLESVLAPFLSQHSQVVLSMNFTCDLFALPARLGDLGIINLTKSCQTMYLASISIANPLASLISTQDNDYSYECITAQLSASVVVALELSNPLCLRLFIFSTACFVLPQRWFSKPPPQRGEGSSLTHEQRVKEIEHGLFTPLVLSLTGGMGRAATVCYKRLASMIALKLEQPYSCTMAWLRCSLSFTLLKSAIQCIRGAHSSIGTAVRQPLPPLDLVALEANLRV